jgi:hypothetical protein
MQERRDPTSEEVLQMRKLEAVAIAQNNTDHIIRMRLYPARYHREIVDNRTGIKELAISVTEVEGFLIFVDLTLHCRLIGLSV